MRNNRLRKIVIWLVAVATISLTVAFIAFMNTGNYRIFLRNSNHDGGKIIDELRTINMENVNAILITAVSSDMHVYAKDIKDIEVHYYGKSFFNCERLCPVLKTELGRNMINITIEYPQKALFNYLDVNLDVFIPKNYIGNIHTSNVSGETWIENLIIENCSCVTVSGNINLKNLVSKDLSLKTTSGNIFIKDMTGNLTANSVSGDLDVSYSIFSNFIDVNSISGKVKIKFPIDTYFNLNTNTLSGKVVNQFSGSIYSSVDDQSELVKKSVNIKTVSGDIYLTK